MGFETLKLFTSWIWLIRYPVVSLFPINKPYLNTLKGRADSTSAYVVLNQ